jgi:cysteine desulfurase/selenocysteine lyase
MGNAVVGQELKFDVEKIRADFPILHRMVNGKKLVYLDNAATTQKPRQVIDRMTHYYEFENSNIHRGVHLLSQLATDAFEATRQKTKEFLNARESREIVFVRGATEGINLVAFTYGRSYVSQGDEILVSAMEHHSNIVPWQMLCEMTGARLRVIPMNQQGELILDQYDELLNEKTRIVAINHVSNALGTVNPVKEIIAKAHEFGAITLVDGAQSAPHMNIDVQDLDADFYVFSGHKIYGPTGIGALYGKAEILENMPPWEGGGDMINSVTFEKTTYNTIPYKFEAGTPNIAGTVGLGAAIDYLNQIGITNIAAYEQDLLLYAQEALSSLPEVRIVGNAKEKASLVSFVLKGVHPHDIGTILDQEGIALRTGHHCAQPVMDFFVVPATARASLAFYNTRQEIDLLVDALKKSLKVFG